MIVYIGLKHACDALSKTCTCSKWISVKRSDRIKCNCFAIVNFIPYLWINLFTYRGSQEQQAQPHPQEIPTNSWYPPSVISSTSSSRPATPSSSSSSSFNLQRPADRPQSPSHVSPSEAAGIIVLLKDKR